MNHFFGQSKGPVLLIHGGAGCWDPVNDELGSANQSLHRIVAKGWEAIAKGVSALDVVSLCLQELEADEIFNSGFGAVIQGDGKARLTAAMMDGLRQRFSGVMGAMEIIHPSILARYLQDHESRVVSQPGVEILCRKLNIPTQSPVTKMRLDAWEKSQKDKKGFDTVGCVVRLADGSLAAGTSTGGRGNEIPGRVSDASTVAGNYASKFCAISCTGIGEEIVDDAVAARIETRVRDGEKLELATKKTLNEALERKRQYGWISVEQSGDWNASFATDKMAFAVMCDGKVVKDSLMGSVP